MMVVPIGPEYHRWFQKGSRTPISPKPTPYEQYKRTRQPRANKLREQYEARFSTEEQRQLNNPEDPRQIGKSIAYVRACIHGFTQKQVVDHWVPQFGRQQSLISLMENGTGGSRGQVQEYYSGILILPPMNLTYETEEDKELLGHMTDFWKQVGGVLYRHEAKEQALIEQKLTEVVENAKHIYSL